MANNIEYIRIQTRNVNDVLSFIESKGYKIDRNMLFTNVVPNAVVDMTNDMVYTINDVVVYDFDTNELSTMSFDKFKEKYYNQVEYVKQLHDSHTMRGLVLDDNVQQTFDDKYKCEYEFEDFMLNNFNII